MQQFTEMFLCELNIASSVKNAALFERLKELKVFKKLKEKPTTLTILFSNSGHKQVQQCSRTDSIEITLFAFAETLVG